MKSYWDGACFGVLRLTLHRIRLKVICGWSLFWRFKACSPPDSVEARIGMESLSIQTPSDLKVDLYGWRVCAGLAFQAPSNLAIDRNGCSVYAKHAFRVPSDLTTGQNGWKTCPNKSAQQINQTSQRNFRYEPCQQVRGPQARSLSRHLPYI